MSTSHSLIFIPEKQLCVGGRVPLWCPLSSLQVAAWNKACQQRYTSPPPAEETLHMALEALCKYSALHSFPSLRQGGLLLRPSRKRGARAQPQGAGGDAGITKGLAPTTGSGSFLPQAARLAREVRGQARGVQTVQAFVLRWVWSVGMQLRDR